jgi:hypothetical protein
MKSTRKARDYADELEQHAIALFLYLNFRFTLAHCFGAVQFEGIGAEKRFQRRRRDAIRKEFCGLSHQ